MNHMIINSINAPWNDDQQSKPPRCPNCKSTDVRFIFNHGACYDCNHVDIEYKFTEY